MLLEFNLIHSYNNITASIRDIIVAGNKFELYKKSKY